MGTGHNTMTKKLSLLVGKIASGIVPGTIFAPACTRPRVNNVRM